MFGGIRALTDISLEVLPKQIVGIIGPNGAGKTTTFNVITGAYRPSTGEVRLDGHAVTAEPSHRIARAGISRTFPEHPPVRGHDGVGAFARRAAA